MATHYLKTCLVHFISFLGFAVMDYEIMLRIPGIINEEMNLSHVDSKRQICYFFFCCFVFLLPH